MIASFFGPNGIVTATSAVDIFYEMHEGKEFASLSPLKIQGFPHTYSFWGKYVLVYKQMSSYAYDSSFIERLHELECKWENPPKLTEFMPYLKKMIMDYKYQLIGIVSGYNIVDNKMTPFVYQISGDSIRRVNVDDSGNLIFNCIYLEKSPIIWRLLQKTKVLNGDKWEDFSDIRIRFDLLSVDKSIDLCRFLIKTNYFVNNIHTELFINQLEMEMVIIEPYKIEITKMFI